MHVSLKHLLQTLAFIGGTELHVKTGEAPQLRFREEWLTLQIPPFSAEQLAELVAGILTDEQRAEFLRDQALEMAVRGPGIGSFRIMLQRKDARGIELTALPVPEPLFPADEATEVAVRFEKELPTVASDPWQTGVFRKRKG